MDRNPWRYLSFGAGVQTTALLLMYRYDEVIFADTGGELPETYAYLERFVKPYCHEQGIPFVVVKAKRTLEQYCLERRTIPSVKYRWSTRDSKIRPICRYLRSRGFGERNPAVCVIGISFDELERMRSDHPQEYTMEYPLVAKRMTRADCERVIADYGWPVPPKSGCFFCPFTPESRNRWLFENHPELWERRKVLEKNGKNYPAATLCPHKPADLLELQFKLEWDMSGPDGRDPELPCDSGACFV